ncbi:hypothetical protein MLD38_034707 [Melastoma candidum]|uniref:Uncharacterized protein n=1 Tax=Melastoma candidum TaxID=119954 RepID=A0ACB9MBB8_9MYRT|nr:hypothetical protein MLD38_034707 [Melastoma candidum]
MKRNYQGITFFRTFSPGHREWGRRGTWEKARPVAARERSPLEHEVGTYWIQVEEFVAAQKAARKRALKFRLLDTMEMTLTRPEMHPNFNAGSPHWNRS